MEVSGQFHVPTTLLSRKQFPISIKQESGRFREEKNFLFLSGIEPRFPGGPVRTLLTIQTELLTVTNRMSFQLSTGRQRPFLNGNFDDTSKQQKVENSNLLGCWISRQLMCGNFYCLWYKQHSSKYCIFSTYVWTLGKNFCFVAVKLRGKNNRTLRIFQALLPYIRQQVKIIYAVTELCSLLYKKPNFEISYFKIPVKMKKNRKVVNICQMHKNKMENISS